MDRQQRRTVGAAAKGMVMAMDGLRGYLQLASGLAEMSRARATEAASALLTLTGGLSSARSGKDVQGQVQDLAEELLAAAAANRRSLIALVRSEVERAMARTPIPPDELDRARAAVAKLSADVEELRAQVLANPAVGEVAARLGLAGRAVTRPVADPFAGDDDGVVVDVAFTQPGFTEPGFTEPGFTEAAEPPTPAPPRRRPPRKQIADQAATRPVPTDATTDASQDAEPRTGTGVSTTPATTKAAAKSAPAKKTATKTTVKKGAGTTSSVPTKKSTAKKSTAKKSTAKKATAKKASATKTASATKSTTTKSTPTKTTAKKAAAKKAAAKKATRATKTAAKRAPSSGGTDRGTGGSTA